MGSDQKALIVVGLGFGGEGKTKVIHDICTDRLFDIDLVMRVGGGSQKSGRINVEVSDPTVSHTPWVETITLSEFGSGILGRVPTHISKHTAFNPIAASLEFKRINKFVKDSIRNGVKDRVYSIMLADLHKQHDYEMVFEEMISVSPDATMITPLHTYIEQTMAEIYATKTKGQTKGKYISARTGTWSATTGETKIFASDLPDYDVLLKKLKLINNEFSDLILDKVPDVELEKMATLLHSIGMSIPTMEDKDILGQQQTVVMEHCLGALLDKELGIPNSEEKDSGLSSLRTLSQESVELLKDTGFSYKTIGVTRTYQTRHGEGGLPDTLKKENVTVNGLYTKSFDYGTDSKELYTKDGMIGAYNDVQGVPRVAYPSIPLLRYAAYIQAKCDFLAVTHDDANIIHCHLDKENYASDMLEASTNKSFVAAVQKYVKRTVKSMLKDGFVNADFLSNEIGIPWGYKSRSPLGAGTFSVDLSLFLEGENKSKSSSI